MQVNLASSSFVEEQEEGGSECDSGQGPHPPVAVGTRLRRLTAISILVQLRGTFAHTHAWMRKHTRLPADSVPPNYDSQTCHQDFLRQILTDSSAKRRGSTQSWTTHGGLMKLINSQVSGSQCHNESLPCEKVWSSTFLLVNFAWELAVWQWTLISTTS